MDISKWLKKDGIICAIGLIAFAPMASMAATGQPRVAPTTISGYSSSMPEARNLLNDMRTESQRVADRATMLDNLANEPNVTDWDMQAHQLRRIKAEVDRLGRQLHRLQGIAPTLPPADQQAVSQAAPLVQYMADNTDDAINYLNAHTDGFWTPRYRDYTQNLDTEARTLARTVHSDEHLGNVEERAPYYQKNLGMLIVFGK